jgi:hypothetical protein
LSGESGMTTLGWLQPDCDSFANRYPGCMQTIGVDHQPELSRPRNHVALNGCSSKGALDFVATTSRDDRNRFDTPTFSRIERHADRSPLVARDNLSLKVCLFHQSRGYQDVPDELAYR